MRTRHSSQIMVFKIEHLYPYKLQYSLGHCCSTTLPFTHPSLQSVPPRPERSNRKSLNDTPKTSLCLFPSSSPIHASTPYHKQHPRGRTLKELRPCERHQSLFEKVLKSIPWLSSLSPKVIQRIDCPHSVDKNNLPGRCGEIYDDLADESDMSE